MLVTGIVLSVFGLSFFCWLLFTLAIYALPFLAGLTAGLAAFHSGAGVIGAFMVGFLVSGAILALGQIAFATTRTPLIRALIGLLYTVPAAIAGYQVSFALAGIGMSADGIRRCRRHCLWRHGLLTHDAVWAAVGRTGHRGNSLAADWLAGARPETLTLSASSLSRLAKIGASKLGSSSLSER